MLLPDKARRAQGGPSRIGLSRLAALALAILLSATACSAVGSGASVAAGRLATELEVLAQGLASRMAAEGQQSPAHAPDSPAGGRSRQADRSDAGRAGAGGASRRKPARSRPFSMDLYRAGDFVSQQTAYWCVAASVQTMMNIIDKGPRRRSAAFQKKLHFQGRRLDMDKDERWRMSGSLRRSGLHGLGLDDWVGLLDVNGYGPYEIDRATTRKGAIRKAARAIRLTGKPAGLVVWRGAHAWVMSGFSATADPARTNDFKVRSVVIQDVWYPSVSSIWGRSRPPGSVVPVAALAPDYLPYKRPGRRLPKRDGKFMLILPRLADTEEAGVRP